MSKKHNPTKPCQPYPPRAVKVADKTGDELIAFPAERNLLTGRQREVPNPAAAMAQIVTAADRPAPTVREDLQAVRRRHWDAPMATPITQLPQPPAPMICGLSGIVDPIATLAWDAVVEDAAATARSWWTRVQAPLAFAVWSAACFLLGRLV